MEYPTGGHDADRRRQGPNLDRFEPETVPLGARPELATHTVPGSHRSRYNFRRSHERGAGSVLVVGQERLQVTPIPGVGRSFEHPRRVGLQTQVVFWLDFDPTPGQSRRQNDQKREERPCDGSRRGTETWAPRRIVGSAMSELLREVLAEVNDGPRNRSLQGRCGPDVRMSDIKRVSRGFNQFELRGTARVQVHPGVVHRHGFVVLAMDHEKRKRARAQAARGSSASWFVRRSSSTSVRSSRTSPVRAFRTSTVWSVSASAGNSSA